MSAGAPQTSRATGGRAPAASRRLRLGIGGAVVLVGAVIAQVAAPTSGVPEPRTVPVVATDLICPDARATSDGRVFTDVSVLTPQTVPGGGLVATPGGPDGEAAGGEVDESGRATVGTLSKPTSLATLEGDVRAAAFRAPAGAGALSGTAVSGRAPGFTLDQLTLSTRRDDHGLAGTTCGGTTNDAWFIGAGSEVGRFPRLFLSNPEATTARVDLTVYSRTGRVEAPEGLGIEVGPRTTRVVSVDRIAPGAGVLALRARVTAGRVGAGLHESEVSGLTPRGADWVPRAEAPATRIVVPGLRAGEGPRWLSLLAPGEGSGTVTVRVAGSEGSFAPAGSPTVELDGGRVSALRLDPAAVEGDDSAIVLESDVPIVAGVRWANTSGALRDLAFTSGSPVLDGPAVVAGNRIDKDWSTDLMLTAAGDEGRVTVQPLAAGVPHGKPRTLTVPAGTTLRTKMPRRGLSGSFAVVITPAEGSGPVHAAVVRTRRVADADGVTISTVRPSRVAVAVPDARPLADVGLGR